MSSYFLRIWESRYFWVHLVFSDLRARWRRSFFGVFWSMLHPLGLTILLSCMLGRFFHINIVTYAPYILSGLIVWEFIVASTTGGASSFIQAGDYIKQISYPLAIYTMRTVLSAAVILLFASIPLYGWSLVVMPQNFGISWLSLFLFYPLLVLIMWPAATLFAYIGTRLRDLPHALSLVLQAVWFVSPVYFEASLFRNNGLGALVDFNPVYHILQLVRAPLLEGNWPSIKNYTFALGVAACLSILAWIVGKSAEREVIFYL